MFCFCSIFEPQIKASLESVPRRTDAHLPSAFSPVFIHRLLACQWVNCKPATAAGGMEGGAGGGAASPPPPPPDRCSQQPDELRGPGASAVATGCLSREVVGQGLGALPPRPFITAADGAPIYCCGLPLGLPLIHQNDKWQGKEKGEGGWRAGLSKRAQCPIG